MAQLPQFENHAAQRKVDTTCYMCACRCGIRVTLEKDGGEEKVRFIQGNPDHPVNKGVLCAKGNAGIMKQMSPAKLQQPLRRVPGTERGDGQFEALDELTARLKHIRETDPNQLAFLV
jgi:anaerobic selenocysteine-containing dehydrogenase